MSRLFARYAETSGRNVAKLEFKLDNTDGRLDGEQTCAEAGVVSSARIIATDKEERVHINAVAGSSTGPGTRRVRSTSTDGGAARAADDRGPHADHQPRPSAPTDNSTADHRPISGPSARLPRPEATSTSSAGSTAPAAHDPTADREARARVDASDSDAGGSSPDYDNPPSKKKAKVVKEKPNKPAAAPKRKMSAGERAYKPSSAAKKGRVQGEKSEGRGGRRLAMDARVDDPDMHENGPTQPQPSVKHATGLTSSSTRRRHQPPGARPKLKAAAESASSSTEAAVVSGGSSTAQRASGNADDKPACHSSLPTPARSRTSSGRSHDCDDAAWMDPLLATLLRPSTPPSPIGCSPPPRRARGGARSARSRRTTTTTTLHLHQRGTSSAPTRTTRTISLSSRLAAARRKPGKLSTQTTMTSIVRSWCCRPSRQSSRQDRPGQQTDEQQDQSRDHRRTRQMVQDSLGRTID